MRNGMVKGVMAAIGLLLLMHPARADLVSVLKAVMPAVVEVHSTMPSPGPSSCGSGFFIGPRLLVTNHHVIANAQEVSVLLRDGRELDVKVVGSDEATDLAVLGSAVDGPAALRWGSSTALALGQALTVIGNPLCSGTAVSTGIVSALHRHMPGSVMDFVQTDAALNRGNSGGPVLDRSGNVIGIASEMLSPDGNSIGLGFAISSADAEALVERLASGATLHHGYLGIQVVGIRPEDAAQWGRLGTDGALVSNVMPGSPAEHAGLQPGDILLELDGKAIGRPFDLQRIAGLLDSGKAVEVHLWRDRALVKLAITLGEAPAGGTVTQYQYHEETE